MNIKNIFKRSTKGITFKPTTPLVKTTRLYSLYGEDRNIRYLEQEINKNNNLINDLNNKIETLPEPDVSKEYVDNQDNRLDSKIDNTKTELVNQDNQLNTKIETTKNDLNGKINKITSDLANANIANYKGLYNNQTTYKLGDLVSDTNTNNVYLSIQNNNINNALTNNNFWKIITFTVDTSNFITDSALTPIRNDITSNRNNISTNSTNIQNLSNRIDRLPSSGRYFDREAWINFRLNPSAPKYWTVGDLRTFEIGIETDEYIPYSRNTIIEYLITATFEWYENSNYRPISYSYYAYYIYRRGSGSHRAGIPVFYITVPTAWGTDIRPAKAFFRAKSYITQ